MADADVIVVGGGPGGSTTATMLARKGWRVVLLERERFPREHIGESLLPASMPVLQELGALEAVQAEGFLPKYGATMVWGADTAPWSWYFRETNRHFPSSFQVWRPRFDQILLENARSNGVEAREDHTVTEVLFEDGDAPGASDEDGPVSGRVTGVRVTAGGRQETLTARFVVDASGQAALLGHRLRLRRWDSYFQNLAVYAYFEGGERLPEPDTTNIFIESYPHGWFWNIPLHTGWMSVGAVVDKTVGQEGIRRAGPQGFLQEQIAQSPATAKMLAGAKLVRGPVVLRDWSYVSTEVAGDGWVLVGDSACFVDPLFSSGVHLAMMSGVLAAAYVTTALKQPALRAATAGVYKDLYYRQYSHFREMARLFYSSNQTVESYFWEARRILGDDPALSPRHAFIRAVAGQSPLGYERAVVERGHAPPEFLAGIRQVEAERVQRGEWFTRSVAAVSTPAALLAVIPVLAAEARVEPRPVLADGEFVMGHVLITAGYPEGTPTSPFVAALVSRLDGRTTLGAILGDFLAAGASNEDGRLEQTLLNALRILYVDGTVTEMRGLGA